MRKLMMLTALVSVLNLQGCATSFETFMLGAAVGGTVFGCSRLCYGD